MTLLVPQREVTIGAYTFDFPTAIEVESSYENLTDTAKITIARKSKLADGTIVGADALIKKGDPVTIKVGYKPNLRTIFTGYVTKVKPKLPVEIECEDGMWKLKQKTITKSYKSVHLKELLADILTGTEYAGSKHKAIQTNLGQFRMVNANITEVFEELRKKYNLHTFLRDGVLYCGLAVWPELQKYEAFVFDGIAATIIDADGLEYRRKEDVDIKIKAVNKTKDNKEEEVWAYYHNGKATTVDKDPGKGELRTYTFDNLTKADLKEQALRALELCRYEGFYGSFTTFLEPRVLHGWGAELSSPKMPEKAGTYIIKKVKTTLDDNGGRQEVTLDKKIS